MFRYEFSLFFRNTATRAGLIILLIAGFTGMYLGKSMISRQQEVIAKATGLQAGITERDLHHFGDELGLTLYHHKFSMAKTPDNWAAFSTGQSDINPYLISFNIRGLEGQLYDTDLNNPATLLLGNLDLAFVFIYLFPLVIIAFTYNLLSAEKESGRWGIIKIQSAGLLKTIMQKMMVRLIAVFAVAFCLMGVAVVYLQLPVDVRFAYVFLVLVLYLLFWFSLSFWVISRNLTSSAGAATLIAFWVMLNICTPALLNVWLTEKYPVPEAMQNVIEQREGYHDKWDKNKSVTMDAFYTHYPQFKKYPFPAELTFSWYWYYAMQQIGDDEAAGSTSSMLSKLSERNDFSQTAALFVPGIQAQLAFNKAASSDLQAHIDFQKAVRRYHEDLRLFFYPIIFTEKRTADVSWGNFSVRYFQAPKDDRGSSSGLLSLGFLSALFSAFAFVRMKKILLF